MYSITVLQIVRRVVNLLAKLLPKIIVLQPVKMEKVEKATKIAVFFLVSLIVFFLVN